MRIANLLHVISLIAVFAATVSAQGNVQSAYTDLNKNCKTLERNDEEAGYLLQQCRGVAGYKIRVVYGDDRANIEVVSPNGSKHDLNFGQIGGGGFSNIGAKAEWRLKNAGGKLVPIALIIRFDVVTNPSNPEKSTSYLVVSKITPRQVCRVGEIDPGANANEEARRMADAAANKPCIKPL